MPVVDPLSGFITRWCQDPGNEGVMRVELRELVSKSVELLEMFDIKPLSRSVQRRLALQRGEPMPTFGSVGPESFGPAGNPVDPFVARWIDTRMLPASAARMRVELHELIGKCNDPLYYVGALAHASVRAEKAEQQLREINDPELDGTDAAHPAWWRGSDHAVGQVCMRLTEVLDGKDDGSGAMGSAELEALRRRLLALVKK